MFWNDFNDNKIAFKKYYIYYFSSVEIELLFQIKMYVGENRLSVEKKL